MERKRSAWEEKEAAEVFYDTEKFKRKNAAPNRVLQTLFGKNGVQSLDGQNHKHRKEMFMSIMSPNEIEKLTDIIKKQWEIAVDKWEQMDKVILYEEAKEIIQDSLPVGRCTSARK